MVDNFSNKKVSDFIYKGFDEQPHKCANPKSCSHPYHKKEKEKEKSENKIVSEVKSIFESAKMSVKSNITNVTNEYEGNTMTINEEKLKM